MPDKVQELAESHESRFLTGQVAMLLNSRRGTPTYREISGFDWDVAPLPQGKQNVGILHADGYCMAAASPRKAAAWTFIEFANSEQGQTIVASLAHARYCRLDNLVAGQVITFGPEAWKVYPMHARNDQQRDGVAWGTGSQHSGTFGVAIRYTGL